MKKIGKLLLLIGIFLVNISLVRAEEDKNLVNIYFFHSDSCGHCAKEKVLLTSILEEYSNVRLYDYEIGNEDNAKLLQEVAQIMGVKVSGVPFTVIGDKVYKGYSDSNSKGKFIRTIEYYSEYGYVDKIGEYIGDIELPSYEVVVEDVGVDEYIQEKESYKLDIPLVGEIELKSFTLPVISILIGLVDGFNPCAMWVLIFLISMLLGMKNRKRMWILGITFLLASALIYMMIMLSWINVVVNISTSIIFRNIIAIVALIGALVNINAFFKGLKKENGCEVVDAKKRKRVIESIKKFTTEKSLLLALLGIISLAVSVNIIELACSAGLPLVFTQILAMNKITGIQSILYTLIYILFFLIDDILIFVIAMITTKITAISTKYNKFSHLLGGVLMLIIGILLIFKPEWIMFNFN